MKPAQENVLLDARILRWTRGVRVGRHIHSLKSFAARATFTGGTETNHCEHVINWRERWVTVELNGGILVCVDRLGELEDEIVVIRSGSVVGGVFARV